MHSVPGAFTERLLVVLLLRFKALPSIRSLVPKRNQGLFEIIVGVICRTAPSIRTEQAGPARSTKYCFGLRSCSPSCRALLRLCSKTSTSIIVHEIANTVHEFSLTRAQVYLLKLETSEYEVEAHMFALFQASQERDAVQSLLLDTDTVHCCCSSLTAVH